MYQNGYPVEGYLNKRRHKKKMKDKYLQSFGYNVQNYAELCEKWYKWYCENPNLNSKTSKYWYQESRPYYPEAKEKKLNKKRLREKNKIIIHIAKNTIDPQDFDEVFYTFGTH